jgi:hypothetical protein
MTPDNKRPGMDDLIPLGLIALWIILQAWALPKMGIST